MVALIVLGIDDAVALEKKTATPQKVRLGVGYIPNVQFTPLYVAQDRGYYADEELDVLIEYGFEHNFVKLSAHGEREFAIASGDQVILAKSRGLPITYVMKWYQRYPVALLIPASKGVSRLDELKGKTIGLPGLYGTTFIGWKALVYAAGIDEKSFDAKKIGFAQVAAIQQNMVDAAMVYIANEPNQLRSQGIEVSLIEVSDHINLVSNGLVVGDKLMADDPGLIRRMVKATLRGLVDTIAHPNQAFAIVRRVIPEITDKNAPIQRRVLLSSIELWKSDSMGLSKRKAWQDSVDFMYKMGLLPKSPKLETLYTNQFIEGP